MPNIRHNDIQMVIPKYTREQVNMSWGLSASLDTTCLVALTVENRNLTIIQSLEASGLWGKKKNTFILSKKHTFHIYY